MHLLLILLLPGVLGSTHGSGDANANADGLTKEVLSVELSQDETFKVPLQYPATKPEPLSALISIQSRAFSEENFSSVRIDAAIGNFSETWTLENGDTKTITLCVDNKASLDHILVSVKINGLHQAVNETGKPKINLRFNFTLNEAVLKIPDKIEKFRVTDEMPYTFVVLSARPDSSRGEHLVLTFKNTDPSSNKVCAVVTVQFMGCPLKNQPNNYESAEMYATMLDQLTLTIRTKGYDDESINKFSEPFFVNVFLHPNTNHCTGGTPSFIPREKLKELSVEIKTGPPYSDYVTPILAALGFIVIPLVMSYAVMCLKKYHPEDPVEEAHSEYNNFLNFDNNVQEISNIPNDSILSTDEEFKDIQPVFSQESNDNDPEMETDARSGDLLERCKGAVIKKFKRKEDRVKILTGLERLQNGATLEDMSAILKEDPWFRRNRSRVYLYLIPMVGIFYFIPAIQFAFLAKSQEMKSGSLDLCYHNFGCSHPLSVFSDFNHVVSNMSYLILGIAFIFLVKLKATKLAVYNNPKFDHNSGRGIMQQLSIFYGMGAALVFQAFFSICYHVCPTNLSLQFDTTMMYIICILVYIKIYQFRHPDVTPNAFSIMMMVGALVFLEALTLYFATLWIFGIFILFYVGMTIFVAFDCYYMGIGRLDAVIAWELCKEVLSCPFQFKRNSGCVKFIWRFVSYFMFCLGNFSYAIYITYEKWDKPNKSVSHVVLTILAVNMMAYLIYYLWKKTCTNCCRNRSFNLRGDRETSLERYKMDIKLSAASIFGLFAILFGSVSLYFYSSRNADRNLSAAESRNLNGECVVLGFYDNHDLWHLFGAVGIYMAFCALLTIDDDLLDVPRNEIPVF